MEKEGEWEVERVRWRENDEKSKKHAATVGVCFCVCQVKTERAHCALANTCQLQPITRPEQRARTGTFDRTQNRAESVLECASV